MTIRPELTITVEDEHDAFDIVFTIRNGNSVVVDRVLYCEEDGDTRESARQAAERIATIARLAADTIRRNES